MGLSVLCVKIRVCIVDCDFVKYNIFIIFFAVLVAIRGIMFFLVF